MSMWIIVIALILVLLLMLLLQSTLQTNRLLEMILNRIHVEIERREDMERQAEEDEIARLRFEADRRAEEESDY